jgi:putative N6-adenine-specific DNA methylase
MKLIAKTFYGLENVLAEELEKLGGKDISVANRAVTFSGNERILYRVNYHSRLALSVLKVISEFRLRSADDLYRAGMKLNWSAYMSNRNSFAVVPVINSEYFKHTGFAALKLKDSIADSFRHSTGSRPSVNTDSPDILINLHISHDRATVSLDSSGEPLFKRGYRKHSSEAPLNEVLAAGMIKLSGWDQKTSFIDPMCGSGTLPVEAAMMASGVPAGAFRESFGFMKWPDFSPESFEEEKKHASGELSEVVPEISGFDISGKAIEMSLINSKSAGVDRLIRFETSDFREAQIQGEESIVIMNPPYGERLSDGDTVKLYGEIGSILKHKFPGSSAWIISPNREALKNVGLKPVKKITLFNGSLECLFLKYELYKGSKRGVNQ